MQVSSNPLVSVVIPVHNGELYIANTIESVQCQSFQDYEIIIVDDGSVDNTLQVVRGIAQKDLRIRIFNLPQSGRPSVPRNKGIREAKGKYIAFLDADDIWVLEKLEAQVQHLQSHNDLSMVYSASITFGAVTVISPQYELLPLPFKESVTYNDLVKRGNTITCSSVIAKKEVLLRTGLFDEDPELKVEDYDLWIRIAAIAKIAFLPYVHVYYRVHAGQFSADWTIKQARVQYMATKRCLPIPEYQFRRNKSAILLIIRNIIHLLGLAYYRIVPFTFRMFFSRAITGRRESF